MSKDYIPVLSCSSGKTKDKFIYKGQSIKFAASPQDAPSDGFVYYKPDDTIPYENKTWRDLVLEQNHPDIVPVYELYNNDIYRKFYREYGDQFYIHSAGWGIIRAGFRLPAYDITYSTAQKVPVYVKRSYKFRWNDINHLKEDIGNFDRDSVIILFAGSDYVNPFCDMTSEIKNKKIILFNSQKFAEEESGGFVFEKYETNYKTNWHIEAAKKFLENLECFAGRNANQEKRLYNRFVVDNTKALELDLMVGHKKNTEAFIKAHPKAYKVYCKMLKEKEEEYPIIPGHSDAGQILKPGIEKGPCADPYDQEAAAEAWVRERAREEQKAIDRENLLPETARGIDAFGKKDFDAAIEYISLALKKDENKD